MKNNADDKFLKTCNFLILIIVYENIQSQGCSENFQNFYKTPAGKYINTSIKKFYKKMSESSDIDTERRIRNHNKLNQLAGLNFQNRISSKLQKSEYNQTGDVIFNKYIDSVLDDDINATKSTENKKRKIYGFKTHNKDVSEKIRSLRLQEDRRDYSPNFEYFRKYFYYHIY
jgi:hypothetical protein